MLVIVMIGTPILTGEFMILNAIFAFKTLRTMKNFWKWNAPIYFTLNVLWMLLLVMITTVILATHLLPLEMCDYDYNLLLLIILIILLIGAY